MAILMKWCDTENQYMVEFIADNDALKGQKSGKYELNDEGVFWELRDEHKSEYSTKEMTPKKKVATRKKAEK